VQVEVCDGLKALAGREKSVEEVQVLLWRLSLFLKRVSASLRVSALRRRRAAAHDSF
jgi:hypothetical protein